MDTLTLNNSEMVNMNLSTSYPDWITMTTFWIEGILTPLISLAGLAGSHKYV